MGISNLLSYDTVLSFVVLSFVLLLSVSWFILKSGINSKNNDEHDKECEEHARLAERAAELLQRKSSSSNSHQQKIVQSVSNVYLHFIQGINTRRVVEK